MSFPSQLSPFPGMAAFPCHPMLHTLHLAEHTLCLHFKMLTLFSVYSKAPKPSPQNLDPSSISKRLCYTPTLQPLQHCSLVSLLPRSLPFTPPSRCLTADPLPSSVVTPPEPRGAAPPPPGGHPANSTSTARLPALTGVEHSGWDGIEETLSHLLWQSG